MYGFGGLGQVEVEEEKMLPQRDGRTNEQTNKKERQSYSAIRPWTAEMSNTFSTSVRLCSRCAGTPLLFSVCDLHRIVSGTQNGRFQEMENKLRHFTLGVRPPPPAPLPQFFSIFLETLIDDFARKQKYTFLWVSSQITNGITLKMVLLHSVWGES